MSGTGRSKEVEVTTPKDTSTMAIQAETTTPELIKFRKPEDPIRGIFILLREGKDSTENRTSRSSFRRWSRKQCWQHCKATAPSSRDHSQLGSPAGWVPDSQHK